MFLFYVNLTLLSLAVRQPVISQTAGQSHVLRKPAYLSPAPHAEPHAAGFSAGLSPAPHAEPHAAGFSAGLSPAPHAVPHAAAGAASLFHPDKLESAIVCYLLHSL